MISIKNLRKEYGTVTAVDGISFEVKKGEVFALLGPNGAGKTTTIKALLGLIQYEGEIAVSGMDAGAHEKHIKKMIGYLPEKVAFYDNLTALQTLQFYAELKGVEDADLPGLLRAVGLEGEAHRKVGGFSKGMIQRLGLAQSLLGSPELLILDEPTTGLDALGAFEVRTKIRELSEQGNTILLSSHILSEVQELSHRVAILNRGKIVAIDTVENLSKKLDVQPKLRIELEHVSDEMVQRVRALEDVRDVTVKGNVIEAICPPSAKLSIIKTIEEAGGTVVDFKTVEPSLEEIFIKVVKDHA